MKPLEIGEHLVIDPRVCHGKMTFKGTRLPVETVLTLMAKKKRSLSYVLKSWPHLKKEAIEEAVRLATVAWPELLDETAGAVLQKLAVSLNGGKRVRVAHEPVHPGRTT
jgi:uncharacterized protein (DUF433 family)